MKIYISADMEGATGITDVWQTMNSRPEYSFGCKMQLHDVCAAVEGALAGGADEVVVNDAHGRMINLDINGLGTKVRLLSGHAKALGMIEGCEGSDGIFFVGYHAMAGSAKAVLDHTISGATVFSISLNGREVGELGVNAAVAAEFGLPVAFVEGDDALEREVRLLLGDQVEFAKVKVAHGRLAAECLTPEDSYPLIREKARRAVLLLKEGRAPKYDIGDGSYDLRITFHTTAQCDEAMLIPVLERIGGRTVRICGKGMAEMRMWANAIIRLAGTGNR